MYRQTPSRNQRSKGIKVKHVLQICLLLAVCFWLIYQVKRSHDKKKEFDETDAKAALHKGSSDEFIKLGRKDVHSRVEETMTKNEKHDEAEEEEETTGEEDEENKHEEEEPEDKKIEEKEDEGMRDGDDETDEHELEKLDTEVDRVEDFADDEKEREDGDEKETEEKDSDDGNGQMEKESSMEDADHDGDDRSTHEARDELYKADDASSEVTHDTQIETTENENERVGNSNEHPENILEQENKENNSDETDKGGIRKGLEVHGGEIAKDENQSNVTNYGTNLTTSETGENTLNSSGTSTEGSDLQIFAFEQVKNSTLDVENNPLDSNSTGHAETKVAESNSQDFFNPSNDTESSALHKVVILEASKEAGNDTQSAAEKNDTTDFSDISNGTDEDLESATENSEEIQNDSVDLPDSSNSLEEKDVNTDLDTLPEIQTEGTNSEDVVAE